MLFFSLSNDLSSVGELVDLMPTQQKQDLHTQMKECKKPFPSKHSLEDLQSNMVHLHYCEGHWYNLIILRGS